MHKVTRKDLQRWEACEEGYRWWIDNCEGLPTVEQIHKLQQHRPDWAVWVLCRVVPDPVGIAVFAAELVLPFYEQEYPGDLRPRKAIGGAKAREAGVVVRTVALTAANAAAAWAAARAAWAAAWAAADAARAASAAADAAASAATANMAMPGAYDKIIKYGLSLLKETAQHD